MDNKEAILKIQELLKERNFDYNKINPHVPKGVMYDLFYIVQEFYGKGSYTFQVFTLNLTNNGRPHINYNSFKKEIVITLTIETLIDVDELIFQLAHEVFHCLMPAQYGSTVTYLEEGMATHFSLLIMAALNIDTNSFYNEENKKYQEALELVRKSGVTSCSIIKKLRKTQPVFSRLRTEDIENLLLPINYETVNSLLKDFYK